MGHYDDLIEKHDAERSQPAGEDSVVEYRFNEHQTKPKHYDAMAIDVYQFTLANNLNGLEMNIVKYVTRRKGDQAKRLDDLRKARATLDRLISHEIAESALHD